MDKLSILQVAQVIYSLNNAASADLEGVESSVFITNLQACYK